MSKHADQITAYQQAIEDGDTDAVRAIFGSFDESELEDFLHALEAHGGAAPLELDAARLQSVLQRAGLGVNEAATATMLSVGSFADFIRLRMRDNVKGRDTVLQSVEDDDHALSATEAEDIESWLNTVIEGDEPDIDLTEEAMVVLARAVGSSPETLLALKEYD